MLEVDRRQRWRVVAFFAAPIDLFSKIEIDGLTIEKPSAYRTKSFVKVWSSLLVSLFPSRNTVKCNFLTFKFADRIFWRKSADVCLLSPKRKVNILRKFSLEILEILKAFNTTKACVSNPGKLNSTRKHPKVSNDTLYQARTALYTSNYASNATNATSLSNLNLQLLIDSSTCICLVLCLTLFSFIFVYVSLKLMEWCFSLMHILVFYANSSFCLKHAGRKWGIK